MNRFSATLWGVFACALLWISCSNSGDTAGVTGTETKIYGQVQDSTGAVVPNARVALFKLVKDSTQAASIDTVQWSETVATAGTYAFDSLDAGTYLLRALGDSTFLGFSDPVSVAQGEQRQVNITVIVVIQQNFNITQNIQIENIWVVGDNALVSAADGSVQLLSDGQGGQLIYVVVRGTNGPDTLAYKVEVTDQGAQLVLVSGSSSSRSTSSSSLSSTVSSSSSSSSSFPANATSSSSSSSSSFSANATSSSAATAVPGWTLAPGQLALGNRNTLVIRNDTLWATGQNNYGQLCTGDTQDRLTPQVVRTDVAWVSTSRVYQDSPNHTVFVTRAGDLYGCGKMDWQGKSAQTTPVKIASGVQAAWAGGLEYFTFTLFLKTDGTLWGLGDNTYGELGSSTQSTYLEPLQILDKVQSAYAGSYRSYAIRSDGTLWRWGYTSYDSKPSAPASAEVQSLALPRQVASAAQSVHSDYYCSFWIKDDGELQGEGVLEYGDYVLPNSFARIQSNVRQASGGISHLWVLDQDGKLWDYTKSTAPTEPFAENVQAFVYGENHGMLLTKNGELQAWGFNFSGEFGNGRIDSQSWGDEVKIPQTVVLPKP